MLYIEHILSHLKFFWNNMDEILIPQNLLQSGSNWRIVPY